MDQMGSSQPPVISWVGGLSRNRTIPRLQASLPTPGPCHCCLVGLCNSQVSGHSRSLSVSPQMTCTNSFGIGRLTWAVLKDETEVGGRPNRVGTYMYIQGVPVVPLKLTRRRKAIVVVQSLSHVQPFVALWTAAGRASQSFSISQSLLKFMSVESVMLSNHLILCRPLLLLPSVFPRVFSKTWSTVVRQL